jgi:mannose-6-phosphate isomerase
MVWGGRRLAELRDQRPPARELYGESWEVSDHPLHRSVIAAGPFAGRSLRFLMEEQREALLGHAAVRYSTFPWLIKLLDAHDWLSVQVHPDENAVRRLWPGEGSKTEAWLVLAADPESRIYAGLRPGVNEKALRAALKAGTVAECLHGFAPRPGDCVFLPAGTVHGVGGGVLLAEIQQTSDATFRLYDWDRRGAQGKPRPLHLEEALASIHWDQGPVAPVHIPDLTAGVGERRELPLARCSYFRLDYMEDRVPFRLGEQQRLQAVLVVRGGGRMRCADDEQALAVGQAWVLPAMTRAVECLPEPTLGLLRCTLPDAA